MHGRFSEVYLPFGGKAVLYNRIHDDSASTDCACTGIGSKTPIGWRLSPFLDLHGANIFIGLTHSQ